MNFFAEFTANAAKQARLLGYAVAAGILVVFVVLAFIVAFFIRNSLIKNDIRNLQTLLESPEYASLEDEYKMLKQQLNEMTNYNYALTEMRKAVDSIDPVPTDLPDVIADCIPSDTFITSYSIDRSTLNFTGYSFTYYSPVEMVYLLNQKDVFSTRPTIQTERVVKEIDNIDQLIKDNKIEAINNYYSFEVSGLLVSNVHVSITRLQDGVEGKVLLGGIETKTVRAGSSYTLSDITEITYAGVNYKLSRIVVNGVQVEEGSFTKVMTDKQFTDVPGGNDEVQLYYSVAPAEG
jgi:cell division protein FtsB